MSLKKRPNRKRKSIDLIHTDLKVIRNKGIDYYKICTVFLLVVSAALYYRFTLPGNPTKERDKSIPVLTQRPEQSQRRTLKQNTVASAQIERNTNTATISNDSNQSKTAQTKQSGPYIVSDPTTEFQTRKEWHKDKAYIESKKRADKEIERITKKLERERVANDLAAQKSHDELNQMRLEKIRTEEHTRAEANIQKIDAAEYRRKQRQNSIMKTIRRRTFIAH